MIYVRQLIMMSNDFDPYDALINMSERLQLLEQAHNKMAHAYQLTENELTLTLHSLRNLQQRHVNLMNRVDALEANAKV